MGLGCESRREVLLESERLDDGASVGASFGVGTAGATAAALSGAHARRVSATVIPRKPAASRGEPSASPRGVARSHDGSCEPFEVEARFGVLGGPGDPGDGVARAPGRVSRGQVDDVVAREGVGDRLGGGLR